MADLVNLALTAIFTENMILALFLGMCSFLACSQNVKTAMGLGTAVTFVLTVTVPINWAINHFLLQPDALMWLGLPAGIDLSFLVFIAFIAVIAATVQILEILIETISPTLYNSLGIFLPLITVNCSILGASLFMEQRGYTASESVVYGFASGIGWLIAILALAAISERLKYSNPPKGLKGFGITMIVTGLMSMAFMAFSGIKFG